jgi:sulfate adenylyltransferase
VIAAHGGVLIDRSVATGAERLELTARAKYLPQLHLSAREIADLELIGSGALSPLTGFMQRADYERVLYDMRLAGGLPWALPVTLAAETEELPLEGRSAGLYDSTGLLRGVMEIAEIFPLPKRLEARFVYGTLDNAHPGIAALNRRKRYLVGGPVRVFPYRRDPRHLAPKQTRAIFASRGWKTIVGLLMRDPLQSAQEYIKKYSLDGADAVLRLQAAIRHAGPRESVFNAIICKNFGCTHFLVGRDGAVFKTFSSRELGIVPLIRLNGA